MSGVLVIAKQRSGTNFLRGILASINGLKNYGEVFQPRQNSDKSYYDNWRDNIDLRYPINYKEAVRQAGIFLQALEARVPIVDVKYNSLHRLIGVWHSPVEAPPIVVAALNLNFTVVHLERRNRLEHAVSTHIAAASGVYVARGDRRLDTSKRHLDPAKLLETASRYDAEAQYVNAFLDHLQRDLSSGRILKLFYEDLNGAEPDALRSTVDSIVGRFGVAADDPLAAPTKKIIPDWRDRVENADELLDAFTSFAA